MKKNEKRVWLIPCICLVLLIALLIFQITIEKNYYCWNLSNGSGCNIPKSLNTLYYASVNIQTVLAVIGFISLHILLIIRFKNIIKKKEKNKLWHITLIIISVLGAATLLRIIIGSTLPAEGFSRVLQQSKEGILMIEVFIVLTQYISAVELIASIPLVIYLSNKKSKKKKKNYH